MPEADKMSDSMRQCLEAQARLLGLLNEAAVDLGRWEADPRTQCRTRHAAGVSCAAKEIMKQAQILSAAAERLLGSSSMAYARTTIRTSDTRKKKRNQGRVQTATSTD